MDAAQGAPRVIDIPRVSMRLADRIAVLPEFDMRRAVMAEWLRETDPLVIIETLAFVLHRNRSGGRPFHLALLAFIAALGQDEAVPYELRRELYALAKERNSDLPRLFLSPVPTAGTEAPTGVPLALSGRALTLGERKQLARGGRRELVEKLLRDPDPAVIRQLLANPRLTEGDVVVIASRRPTSAELQREVFASRRWLARYRIKRTLVLNPYTPSDLALRLLCFLHESDLDLVAQDSELGEPIRLMARELRESTRSEDRTCDPDAS